MKHVWPILIILALVAFVAAGAVMVQEEVFAPPIEEPQAVE